MRRCWKRSAVFLTSFRWTKWGRSQAAISHSDFPGETTASAPDATDPWPSLHATLLCQEGLAARRSVNKHIIEQHTGEAPKHVHGPEQDERKQCLKKESLNYSQQIKINWTFFVFLIMEYFLYSAMLKLINIII